MIVCEAIPWLVCAEDSTEEDHAPSSEFSLIPYTVLQNLIGLDCINSGLELYMEFSIEADLVPRQNSIFRHQSNLHCQRRFARMWGRAQTLGSKNESIA